MRTGEMSMKSISIIGLGWLGLPLAQRLQALGYAVKGSKQSAQRADALNDLGLNAFPLFLKDHFPKEAAQAVQADVLIVTLPPSKFSPEDYLYQLQTLSEHAAEMGVKQLIFTSSIGVFPLHEAHFEETHWVEPDNATGELLRAAENLLLRSTIPHCDILRLGGLIGQGRHPIKQLAGKRGLKQGNSPVNLLHLDDAIAAIIQLLQAPNGKRLYHLCAPVHPTKAQYYAQAAAYYGLSAPEFICANHDPQRIILGEKICRELGFVYRYPDPQMMFSVTEL